ncbi:MAG: hypothetical protein ACKVU4_14470 [Phycisphaerales bacterium]
MIVLVQWSRGEKEMNTRCTAISGAVLAVMPAVARADILFDQPCSVPFLVAEGVRGFLSETDGQKLCDDFTLTADSTITHVRWAGSYRTTFVPNLGNPWSVGSAVSFQLRFFNFAGLVPMNDPFASVDVQANVVGILGQVQGFNIYEYEAAVPVLPTLAGGVRYAVAILESAPATIPAQSLWVISPHTAQSVSWVYVNPWQPNLGGSSSAFAFQLRGEVVPAPGGWGALVVAAAWCGRRRRQVGSRRTP